MTAYPRRFIKARLPRLVARNTNRPGGICGVMIHATRSGTSMSATEDLGTENWMNNPNNGGAAYDALVYRNGLQVQGCRWEEGEEPRWAAGWGEQGSWSAQDHYLHLEIPQGTTFDPYDYAAIDSAAQWVAEWSRTYTFPLERIPWLAQTGVPPRGICTHEGSSNGRRLGKSDPGPVFPWDLFLGRCRFWATEGEMDPRLDAVIAALGGMESIEAWNARGNSLLAGYALEQEKLAAHLAMPHGGPGGGRATAEQIARAIELGAKAAGDSIRFAEQANNGG